MGVNSTVERHKIVNGPLRLSLEQNHFGKRDPNGLIRYLIRLEKRGSDTRFQRINYDK